MMRPARGRRMLSQLEAAVAGAILNGVNPHERAARRTRRAQRTSKKLQRQRAAARKPLTLRRQYIQWRIQNRGVRTP
ncbi:MAG: hypothetical protein HY527_10365 [Betaproteobacteria bacterium]|nr:hypothetical protein [Betaproteobacteria bacterium]